MEPWVEFMLNFEKAPSLESVKNPRNGRFEYPSGKRRTKENVAIMQRSEQNLDAFWTKVDKFYKNDKGATQHEWIQRQYFSSG
jgi:hypothetical protein